MVGGGVVAETSAQSECQSRKGRKDGRKHVWMCIIIAAAVCLIIVLWAQIETLKCAHSLTRSLWHASENFASEHYNNVVRFVKWSFGTQMSYGLMYGHSSVTSDAKWNCHLFSSGTFDIIRHLGQSISHLDCFMCVYMQHFEEFRVWVFTFRL